MDINFSDILSGSILSLFAGILLSFLGVALANRGTKLKVGEDKIEIHPADLDRTYRDLARLLAKQQRIRSELEDLPPLRDQSDPVLDDNHLHAALEAALRIPSVDSRSAALIDVARSMQLEGHGAKSMAALAGALDAARQVSSDSIRAELLEKIVDTQLGVVRTNRTQQLGVDKETLALGKQDDAESEGSVASEELNTAMNTREADSREHRSDTGLAELLARQPGREREAENAYWHAIERGSTNGYLDLAELLARQPGREREAENAYWHAIERGSTNGYLGLAELLARQPGREREAENAYWHAIERGSTNGYLGLAELLARQPGREQEAENAYWRAIELTR